MSDPEIRPFVAERGGPRDPDAEITDLLGSRLKENGIELELAIEPTAPILADEKALRGMIETDSEEGRGTTFTIRLPLRPRPPEKRFGSRAACL